ncbi:unnamed protein product, partial [Mesorhabditis belari]|uniref:Protein HIRA n=1 Tax=Mesorhabditis belari TaxID=2138241 RepID=A0AAF3EZ53_9BILA
MRVRTLPWLHHEGQTFFSIHANPVYDKIATCGPNEKEGLVRIWNLVACKVKSGDFEEKPTILASIDFPTNVNAIRWSPNGKRFACGSDDKQVTIWEYGFRVQSVGSIGKRAGNLELYKNLHTLAYHNMEVTGVEWSPCGRFLASSSLDNRVVIWNAQSFPDRVAVLNSKNGGHSDSVKGIAWDPIGTYFCTQSTDKTLKVWRCEHWKLETTIEDPFKESVFSAIFFHLDWSPDGQYLFCPMAKNNNLPICQIITRGSWNTDRDFVGHRKGVVVVKCCPRLFEYKDHKGILRKVSIIGMGSSDCALSLWAIPFLLRPLIVFHHLFNEAVVDLTWRGSELFAASRDGTVRHLPFTEKDLGRMLTMHEMADECQKLYQTCPTIYREISNGKLDDFPKSLSATNLEDQLSPFKARKSSREEANQRSEEERIPEKTQTPEKVLQSERATQIETKDDKGRRRIQPKFISSISSNEMPEVPIPPKSLNKNDFVLPSTSRPDESMDSPEKESRVKPSKRKRVHISSSSESDGEREIENLDRNDPQTSTRKETVLAADFKRPELRTVEPLSFSQGTLAIPDLKKSFSINVLLTNGGTIEIENEWTLGGGIGKATKIGYVIDGDAKWTLITTSPVLVAAGNKYWCLTGSTDRYIQLIDSSCGRLVVTLVLDGVPVRVGVQSHFAFALTSTGHFYSWNLQETKLVVNGISVSDIIASEDATISSVNLTNNGVPIIGFSSGNLFTYSLNFARWVLLDRGTTCMSRCFDGLQINEMSQGYLSKALRKRIRSDLVPLVNPNIRSICKESQLEEWLAGSRAAGSIQDFQSICKVYARFLIEHNNESKLRVLLKELRSPCDPPSIPSHLLTSIESLIRSSKDLSHLVASPDDSLVIF